MLTSNQVEDLSAHHGLISDLFQWPSNRDEWEQYMLKEEQVKFFQEHGYLLGIKLLNDRQVDVLNAELALLTDPDHPGNGFFYEFHSNEAINKDSVLFHALGAWRISKAFHDILWNPAFVMACSQLLGGQAIRFWHDQLFCKPARHGGVVAWHQDYSYWTRTVPMSHLTCWVGLDDTSIENGCMHYVPDSHKWGLLDKPEIAGDMEGINAFLTEEQKAGFQTIPVEMKRGYGSFHHPLLVHGSYENHSEHSRRAFVLNAFTDGVRSATDEPLLQGVPAIPSGQKMQGRFFPLLFDPVVELQKA